MGISFAVDWKTMVQKGGWAAYSLIAFNLLTSIFTEMFLVPMGIVSRENDDTYSVAIKFLTQLIFNFGGSILVLLFCKSLRQRIINTLKSAKLSIITAVAIFLILYKILELLMNISTQNNDVFLTKDNSISKNQEALNSLLKTPFGTFVLILGTIFLAPINEEIACRHGTFTIVRYKWLGYLATFIYFPSMHVIASDDWSHIQGYLTLAALLPLLFIISNGNVTYTIALHATFNTFATIILIINNK